MYDKKINAGFWGRACARLCIKNRKLKDENILLRTENALLKDAQTVEEAKVGTDEEVIAFLHDTKYYHTRHEKRAGIIIDRLLEEIMKGKQ